MPRTPKVFLDANILFAAAYSSRGGSREIIRRGIAGKLVIIVSTTVLNEAVRNLQQKAPAALEAFRIFIGALDPLIAEEPSQREVENVSRYVNPEDAIVLAEATKADVDYFVTLDKKHFLKNIWIGRRAKLKILSPRQLLQSEAISP